MTSVPAPVGPPADAEPAALRRVADWLEGVVRETDEALAACDPALRANAERNAVQLIAIRMQALGHTAQFKPTTVVGAFGYELFSADPYALQPFRQWPAFARQESAWLDCSA